MDLEDITVQFTFSAVRQTALLAAFGVILCHQAVALPILAGNEHTHNNTVTTWSSGDKTNGAILHQHWNALPLSTNNGETSWNANKAWDNNGTTTTFHSSLGGDTDFGHGFIANRVLYYFDTAYTGNAYELRVEQAFNDWVTGARTYYTNSARTDVVLGFNFTRAAARPTETYINVKFNLTDDNTTGEFDSGNQTISFNLEDFTWYTGAAAPGAGQQDFLSTARHEIGHAVGFGHNKNAAKVVGSSIMWSSAAAQGDRIAITNGDFEGVMALYTQPVPEPSTVLGGLVVVGIVAIRRRRR